MIRQGDVLGQRLESLGRHHTQKMRRARVGGGWRILKKLSDISDSVIRLHSDHAPAMLKEGTNNGLSVLAKWQE